MISGIIRLAERPVREMMTPRTQIDWIEVDASEAELRETIAATPHSMLPVAEGSPDEKVVGVVKVREVLALLLAGEAGGSGAPWCARPKWCRTSSMRWMRCGCSSNRAAGWRWCMMNMATLMASSPPPICSPR